MILAVPILVAVSLFLGWMLMRLAVDAFPFLAGLATMFAVLPVSGSVAAALLIGLLAALTVAMGGPLVYGRVGPLWLRVASALLFAIPAGVAAWHAALGITGYVAMAGAWRDVVTCLAALVVGAMAWRRLEDRAASRG